MKYKYISLYLFILLTTVTFAQEPDVSYNVTVLKNATPDQCSNYRGSQGPEDETYNTGGGQITGLSGPGVETCTGCSVQSNGDCVCKKCYTYFHY